MRIPTLNPVIRKREYEKYNDDQRAQVVRGWLFDGTTTRDLDRVVLGLDRDITKGWQSMGILHFLGLNREFQGLFRGMTEDQAVQKLEAEPQNFGNILALLAVARPADPVSLSSLIVQEQREVDKSLQDSSATRRKRLAVRTQVPERLQVYSFAYRRSPDVVAEALIRADGRCELCGNSAPFIRGSDGSPFLEVHHIVQLARGGRDSLENVVALCPNCHREAHLGAKMELIRSTLAQKIIEKEARIRHEPGL